MYSRRVWLRILQLTAITLLVHIVESEENSILDNATVLDNDIREAWTFDHNALINKGFKTMVHSIAGENFSKQFEFII